MSHGLINRSPDLTRLRDEGYEIDVAAGYLIIRHVPYVTAGREVKYGALVSTLELSAERTRRPDTHVVFFVGEQPCHKDGREILALKHQESGQNLGGGIFVDRSFSNKPADGFCDYYEKMTSYVNIISGPAESMDANVTAKTFIHETTEEESVFAYMDTATTRAGIGAVSARLAGHRVAIVGLGGSGSYVLDLVAKTPVSEIHLFDSDRFLQHNAFRAPGAPSLDELRESPSKVEYFQSIYSRMHKGVRAHAIHLDAENANALASMDFAFLCLDSGRSRKEVIEALHRHNKPFIDVGMGVEVVEEQETLVATLRVSTSTPKHRAGEKFIPTADSGVNQDYNRNVQIADLNCLNAAFAVLRWKKICGFYQDLEHEHFSAYVVNINGFRSEECFNGKD